MSASKHRSGWSSGRLVCVVLIAVAPLCLAQSQPPAPGGRVRVHEESASASQSTQDRAGKQLGTVDMPLVVESIAAPDSEDDASYREYEHHEKPSLDRWATYSSVALAVFTFLLFVFTAMLWWVTFRLSRDAKESSTRQSAETRRSLEIALLSANAAKEAADLARQQFVASHLPRLSVRNVVVKQPDRTRTDRLHFARGELVSGQFYVENSGGTRARIVESHCEVYWTDKGLPMERPYEGRNPNDQVGHVELRPGQSIPAIFQSESLMDEFADRIALGTANWRLYVMGWIAYLDDSDIRRRAMFCRTFDGNVGAANGRFVRVHDTDYENEG